MLPWLRSPNLYFLLFLAISLILLRTPLHALLQLSSQDDRYSHLIFMPFVSLGLMYLERRQIFYQSHACPHVGMPLLVLSSVFYGTAHWGSSFLTPTDRLSVSIFAILLIWAAGFVCCYGIQSFKAALFPFSILLLAVPMPLSVVESVESVLQRASAEVAYGLFRVTATPVFREGLTFSLPGVVIEVARECSGIRSFTALCIITLLMSHFFLRSNWSKACLVMLIIPIAIFKNAVRITTLSWLGIYVSMDFLTGPLHHRGGPLFSLLAIALLIPMMLVLQRFADKRPANRRVPLKDQSRYPSPLRGLNRRLQGR